MIKLVRPLCGTLALVTLATTAAAQSPTVVGTLSATATVSGALSFGAPIALTFGTVFPGIAKQVLATGPGAGKFSVTGNANAQVEFSFLLPANLTSGVENLLVLPTSWTGCHNTTDATSGCVAFTPSATNETTRLHASTGALFVYVGATVSPTANQAALTYTGTVTMNIRYTGL